MDWVLYIVGGVIALFALLLVWGLLRIRQGVRMALAEAQKVEVAEIEALAQECVDVFQRRLGVRLDLADCEDAAAKLDAAFQDRQRLKDAFARDDFYWYFAKPVGACLGELLRRHARHTWRKRPSEAPYMEVQLADGESEVYPFEKVVKHSQVGDPGDLIAYIALARTLGTHADKE